LHDFSYHLNTTPAVKSAQGTSFNAGKKELLSRKSVVLLQMPVFSIQLLLLCSYQHCPFQFFVFFVEEEGGGQGYF